MCLFLKQVDPTLRFDDDQGATGSQAVTLHHLNSQANKTSAVDYETTAVDGDDIQQRLAESVSQSEDAAEKAQQRCEESSLKAKRLSG